MSLCVFLWINFILLLIYLYILMMNRNDLCTSKFSALMETLDTRIIQFPTKNAWLTVFFITVYVWFWFCIFSATWDFSHFIQFIRLVFKIKFYILQVACKILHIYSTCILYNSLNLTKCHALPRRHTTNCQCEFA